MASSGTFTTPDAAPQHTHRRLYRSSTNRVFSGVCAGVAEYFGGDPTMVRLATAILGLMTGIVPMVILYVVAAIVVPERGVADPAQAGTYARPAGSGNGALILGLILIAIGAAGFAREVMQIEWDVIWPVALIAIGGAFVLVTFRR